MRCGGRIWFTHSSSPPSPLSSHTAQNNRGTICFYKGSSIVIVGFLCVLLLFSTCLLLFYSGLLSPPPPIEFFHFIQSTFPHALISIAIPFSVNTQQAVNKLQPTTNKRKPTTNPPERKRTTQICWKQYCTNVRKYPKHENDFVVASNGNHCIWPSYICREYFTFKVARQTKYWIG